MLPLFFPFHNRNSLQSPLLPLRSLRAPGIRLIAQRVQMMPSVEHSALQSASRLLRHHSGAVTARVGPREAATTRTALTAPADRAVGTPNLVPARVRTLFNYLPQRVLQRWRYPRWQWAKRPSRRPPRKPARFRAMTLGGR